MRQRDQARVQLEAATAARDAEALAPRQAEAVAAYSLTPSAGPIRARTVVTSRWRTCSPPPRDRLDTQLADSPLIKADLVGTLGLTFNGLGLPAQAAVLREEAAFDPREVSSEQTTSTPSPVATTSSRPTSCGRPRHRGNCAV